MWAITRQMLEELKNPNDSIRQEDWKIIADIDHFEMRNWVLMPVRSEFKKQIWEALSPFLYLKPDVSEGDLLSPETQWEDVLREWYQVIWRVDDSARMANHVDAIRNALIMAIKNGNWVWETRYFPEGNLKPEAWDEWNALLNQ